MARRANARNGLAAREFLSLRKSPFFGNRWLPQTTCADCAGSSGDLLPPSPPAEKTHQDQAGEASTGDGAGDTTAGDRRIVVSLKAAIAAQDKLSDGLS